MRLVSKKTVNTCNESHKSSTPLKSHHLQTVMCTCYSRHTAGSPNTPKLAKVDSVLRGHAGGEYIPANHYCDVIMGTMASEITGITIVYSTFHSGADRRKHQSSAAPAFVRGVHRWPMNSPHKWPVTRKMLPFDDVIMYASFVFLRYLEWRSYNCPIPVKWDLFHYQRLAKLVSSIFGG